VHARAYVGTSGWNYKHWRELIYPKGFPQRRWLDFTAEHFNTVEVNTSFYRIPKRDTIEAWHKATPSSFVFALKIWRGISHYRKLKNAETFTTNFLDVAEALPENRRAPLLLQLPPNYGKDVERLRSYLSVLHSLMPSRWQVAVEFRNDSWLDAEVYRVLDANGAALCLHDMPGRAAVDQPNDVPFVYIRRHGTAEGRYSGSYSPDAIVRDAERMRCWVAQGRSAYLYYNNDIGGHAFWNALAARDMISGS
jgi:uncharacterized protein YecE (DUF72 family)